MDKLQALADKIHVETEAELKRRNLWAGNQERVEAVIKPGQKYTRVDVGGSGKYMVDAEGNIYGVKAYGVIHRGHWYGTLDTIDAYFWGGYVAQRIK
jgi:hypothetical protein